MTNDTRWNVLARDNFQCQVCGESNEDRLHLHHIIFRSHGGEDDVTNLITLCFLCHRKFHDHPTWLEFTHDTNNQPRVYAKRYL